MASTKGKSNMGLNRVTEDNQARGDGVKKITVYSEIEKLKVDTSSIRNAVPVKKGAALSSATDTKAVLNKMRNISKGKSVSSANTKVGRIALADVSNITRNLVHDGSKSLKGERSAFLQRVAVGPGARSVNVSAKLSSMGKVRNTSQVVGDIHTSKKGIKDLTSSSDDQLTKTKGQEHESVGDRRNSRIPPIPTRKSLPVSKRVSHSDTSTSKENAGSSERAKHTSGFPVKPKVAKKVLSRTSDGSNQFWRSRVSDGFTAMARRGQTNADAPPLSRKSIQPIVKTTLMASNTQGTSKSRFPSGPNKSVSVSAISLKNKKEAVRSSLPKSITAGVSQEATQGKPSLGGNSNPCTSSSDIIAKKSDRRRSFTSLLMTRSKLLEEHGEAVKQEKLPSIDDGCNQLEVAEYVDEIYQYYWVTEAQNPPLGNYMSIQTDVTPHMRGILINWLVEVHFKFELMQETLYLMVTLVDRYLSQVKVEKNEMQLVGLTALLLASKYEDFWHPRVKDLISISAESYTRGQMLGMEKFMLKKLMFRLNLPTPYVFMLRFLKAAQSDKKLEHLAFYLIELSLVEYEALKYKSSLLCASAVYVARCTLQMTPVWTPLLGKHTRYDVPQMRDCAEMILRYQKVAKIGKLKVTYEKHLRPELSGVAAIKPLDILPL